MFSYKFGPYFKTPFYNNASGELLLFVLLIDNKSGLVSDKSNSTILINTSSFYQIAGLNVLFQSLLF